MAKSGRNKGYTMSARYDSYCRPCQSATASKRSLKIRNMPIKPAETTCYYCDKAIKGGEVETDHWHTDTDGGGPFRAWSCRACNLGISYFQDNPSKMIKVAHRLYQSDMSNYKLEM